MGAGASTSHFIEEEVKILADFSSENAWAYDSEKWCVRAPPLSPPRACAGKRDAAPSRQRSATAAAAAAPARAASPSLAQADAAEL